MFGKILLTLIIVLLALIWLRRLRQDQRRRQAADTGSAVSGTGVAASAGLNDHRLAAWLFLILMISAGAYLYYERWQEASSVVTVILHSDGAANPVTYQVYRGELGERSFTTIDGVRVTVAASERMEIIGLQE